MIRNRGQHCNEQRSENRARRVTYTTWQEVARKKHDHHLKSLPPWFVYNDLHAILIDLAAKITTETRRQADIIFEQIKHDLGPYKLDYKRTLFHQLVHTARVIGYLGGCIRYSRGINLAGCSKVWVQLIDAAVRHKLFLHFKSPKGSPKMSRLIPIGRLLELATVDPWTIEPNHITQFVYLRDRETGQEIPFNPKDPTALDVQQRLKEVNEVNNQFTITHQKWDEWESNLTDLRRLRPVHYAIFTDNFDQHGRIYTSRYGGGR